MPQKHGFSFFNQYSKMRIVIDARMAGVSGIGRYINSLMPFLCDAFDVTAITCEKTQLINCNYSEIHFRSGIYTITEQIEMFRQIPPCDVFWSPHYNIPLLPVSAKKRIVTIHDVCHLAYYNHDIRSVYAKLMLIMATRRSDLIFTVSDFSRNEIIRYTHADKQRIVTVKNGIDNNIFKRMPEAHLAEIRNRLKLPERFLLFVGNNKPHKNLKNLLMAVKTIHNVPLVVVCDDDIKEVIQLKNISDSDLSGLYNMAKALIIPSLYEGFGLPAIEAQACGCPVVASYNASLPEIGGYSFLYCDPNDPTDIKKAIETVINDEQAKQQIISKGFDNSEKYSWTATAAEMIDRIRSIL